MPRPTFHERRGAFRHWVRTQPRQGEQETEKQYAAWRQPVAALPYWAHGVAIPDAAPSVAPVPGYQRGIPEGDVDGQRVPVVGPGLGPGGFPASRHGPGGTDCRIPGMRQTPVPPARGPDAFMQQSTTTWDQANKTPPIRSKSVVLCNTNSVVVGDGAYVRVISRRVPDRCKMAIVKFGFSAESGAADQDVTWRALCNGIPLPNLDALGCEFGTVREPRGVNWRFNQRDLFEVQFIAATAGAVHNVRAIAKGWEFVPSFFADENINSWNGR